jgi:hypothetical protein
MLLFAIAQSTGCAKGPGQIKSKEKGEREQRKIPTPASLKPKALCIQ